MDVSPHSIEEALVKSRQGHITINTPHAAADLHSSIVDEFGLDFETVRLKRVELANIIFTVKNIVFNFAFSPGSQFSLLYRHMESDDWKNAKFEETDDDLRHLMGHIKDKVFENPPSPIS